MAHNHAASLGAPDLDKSRRLLFATLVTVGILLAEGVGAWLSGSLALLSDAGHVFADVFSLILSLAALRLACRLPTDRRTYGLHRAEIFAALLNGLTLFVIAALIGHEAWRRFFAPPEIHTGTMLAVAVLGLLANWLVLTRLSGHHQDLNMRGAYLHVLGDLLASVGVVAAGLVMRFTGWFLADPIISVVIALLILGSAWRLVTESMHILLLGVPRQLDVRQVAAAMLAVPGVDDVHNMRLWAVCSNVYVMSAHVVACVDGEEERVRVRAALRELLAERFGVAEATLEIEETACAVPGLIHPLTHPAGNGNDDHDHGHEDHDH
jgi:cobalt-zinc-cadmium efflux system protein